MILRDRTTSRLLLAFEDYRSIISVYAPTSWNHVRSITSFAGERVGRAHRKSVLTFHKSFPSHFRMSVMTEQTLVAPIDEPAGAGSRLFALPVVARCAAGVCPVHDHPRLHDHVAARRHHHAGAEYHRRAVRRCGLGLCVQRGNFRHPCGRFCRPIRPQAPAVVLLRRLHPRNGALRRWRRTIICCCSAGSSPDCSAA